jgi:hypothetical protein
MKDCPEGKVRNPKTNRCIKIKEVKTETKKEKKCPKGKVLNPKTNRCINIKEVKTETKKEKKCPKGKVLNPLTNQCIKIKSVKSKSISKPKSIDLDKKANIVKRNLRKLLFPFVNRVSANIYDRRVYFKLLMKHIATLNSSNKNCMRFYKYNTDGEPIFRIGDKIILNKRIGSDSMNAVVYLSSFRDKTKKLFKFATKITLLDDDNTTNEAKILSFLTKNVLEDKCPHFPILYGLLRCHNFMDFNNSPYLTSNSTSQNSLKRINPIYLNVYPDFILNNKYHKTLINLVELANGDLKSFIDINHNNSSLMENAFAQIYFSLMFFYKTTNMMHRDANWGNFLFHKIKPGGYFHYKIFDKDYYIENLGYLWVIWDFDFSRSFDQYSLLSTDFNLVIRSFIHKNEILSYIKGFSEKIFNEDLVVKINNVYYHLFKTNLKDMYYSPENINYYFRVILIILEREQFIKSIDDMTRYDIIINKKPYIITPFV